MQLQVASPTIRSASGIRIAGVCGFGSYGNLPLEHFFEFLLSVFDLAPSPGCLGMLVI